MERERERRLSPQTRTKTKWADGEEVAIYKPGTKFSPRPDYVGILILGSKPPVLDFVTAAQEDWDSAYVLCVKLKSGPDKARKQTQSFWMFSKTLSPKIISSTPERTVYLAGC